VVLLVKISLMGLPSGACPSIGVSNLHPIGPGQEKIMKNIAMFVICSLPIVGFLLMPIDKVSQPDPWPPASDRDLPEIAPEQLRFGRESHELADMVKHAAQAHGLPPMLVLAMAQVESSLRPDAVSPKGAIGILQIVPHSAGREVYRLQGLTGDPDPDRLKDPRYNLEIASQYIHWLRDYFKEPGQQAVPAHYVVAAYNGGPTRVRNCLDTHGQNWLACMPTETQQYVRRVSQIARLDTL
jgi:soluble lytic murein transglycosylase-like protein